MGKGTCRYSAYITACIGCNAVNVTLYTLVNKAMVCEACRAKLFLSSSQSLNLYNGGKLEIINNKLVYVPPAPVISEQEATAAEAK